MMNITSTKNIILFIVVIIIITLMPRATYGDIYTYRDSYCFYVAVCPSGDNLYISYPMLDEVVQIDTLTMTEIQSFSVLKPLKILVSPDENYLYVKSADDLTAPTTYFVRIDINTGNTESITLNGVITHFTINEQGSIAWITHRTYPIVGVSFSEIVAMLDYPDSGYVTKVDLQTFSILDTVNTFFPLPVGIWYSEYSDEVYVYHDISDSYLDNPYPAKFILALEDDLSFNNKGTIGGRRAFGYYSSYPSNYSDDGRFFVVPNENPNMSFTFRIYDTTSLPLIPEEVAIPNPTESDLTVEALSIKKVPNQDFIWAIGQAGEYSFFDRERPKVAIRLNTVTHDYEIFDLPDLSAFMRYFDISPDGRTLYIPFADESDTSIVVFQVNHDPICLLEVVSPMPYVGSLPAAITFDASGSYDPDGDELNYHWDFNGDGIFDGVGDEYTGDPWNPTHEFNQYGIHDVILKVTDNYGGECYAVIQVTIIQLEM